MNLNEQTEQLLETSCWVIDPLPCQVPADGEGQFFAAEQYWLAPPRMAELRAHFFQILLKLNCYYDFVLADAEGRENRNPDPENIPCYRVVNSKGMLAEAFVFGGINIQEKLLKADGIEVREGRVNLDRYGWDGVSS